MRLAETRAYRTTLEGRLSNENYIAKAPAHLVEETRKELESTSALELRLETELSVISNS